MAPDRDARRAALRHAADAHARGRSCPRRCSPARPPPARRADIARQARDRASCRSSSGRTRSSRTPSSSRDLAVAVVDEQHRFGVRQRAALDAKAPAGLAPHVLHMTATPIPRTLRLASFGALDVTALRELPRGRQPIETHVASRRARARARLRAHPRGAARRPPGVRRLPARERVRGAAGPRGDGRVRAAARDGARGLRASSCCTARCGRARRPRRWSASRPAEADVLVATTVIEVGIDVPNATVMLVEDAERYGISQLHQLRGRVGRGEHASLCLLFGPKESARLQALAQHSDGFALAEIDLELRGEGELTGTRQSGLARFRFARLPEDADVLERAHACASDARSRHLRASPSTRCWPTSSLRGRGEPGRRVRVVAGRPGGRRLAAPPGPGHAPDVRPRARGAVLDARPARRRARARPLRGLGRAGHRGAVARGGQRAARRARRPRVAAIRANLEALGHGRDEVGAPRRPRGPAQRTRPRRRIRSVFLDPPYRHAPALGSGALRAARPPCSRPAARVVAESDRRAPLELALPLVDERRYGDTLIRIHTHDTLIHRIAVCPGSYDPITYGHLDVIAARVRALRRGRRRRRQPPVRKGKHALRHRGAPRVHRGAPRSISATSAPSRSTSSSSSSRADRRPRDREGPARDLRLRVRDGDEPAQPQAGAGHRHPLPDGQPPVQFPQLERRQGARDVRRADRRPCAVAVWPSA